MSNFCKTYNNILTALAVAVLTACNGETFPLVDYDPAQDNVISPTNGEYVNQQNLPFVLLGTQQDFISIASKMAATKGTDGNVTKGTGAVDAPSVDATKFYNTTYHTFVFADGSKDFTRSAWSPSKREANDPDRSVCLVDGTNYLLGMPMKFNSTVNDGTFDFLTPNGETIVYNDKYRKKGYNIFAYHIDDFVPTTSNTIRDSRGIYYDIDIDGARDIIQGSAPRLTDSLLQTSEYKNLIKTKQLRDSILAVGGGYSKVSAEALLQPHVTLKHKFVRLTFDAYPAGTDKEAASAVVLKRIAVIARDKVRMKVVGEDPDDIGLDYSVCKNEKEIPLSDLKPNGQLRTDGWLNNYKVIWKDDEMSLQPTERTKTIIGDSITGKHLSLLIPPPTQDNQYEVNIYYKAHDDGKDDLTGALKMKAIIGLKDGMPFEEGTMYNVRLQIFGPREIGIDAALDGGEYGGYNKGQDISIDTEDWEVHE